MLDKTTIFAYDNSGNITSRVEYKYSLADTSNLENGYTYNYEYASQGWRDQLLSYNGAICGEYDNLGNPSVYRGKRLSWSHGRQLDSIGDITYKYNSNGVRIAKTANGVTTKFYLDGAAILAQEVGNRLMLFTRGVDGLNGFTLDGAEYFYKKNIQGDINAIMESTGVEIVRYVYDAWGNHKTYVLANGEYKQMSEAQHSAYAEVAQLNPYRYRGYYYDIETGLYYLNSRYYDSEVGRFINADNMSEAEPNDINGLNLYAYCLNNPVMLVDDNGNKPKWWQWLLGALVAIAVTAAVVLTAGGAALALGAYAAATTSIMVGTAVGGIIAGGTNLAMQAISNADEVDFGSIALSSFIGSVSGAISSGIAGFSSVAVGGHKLAQIGMQIGANVLISQMGYVLSSVISREEMTPDGFIIATIGGFLSGRAYNSKFLPSLILSLGIEIAGYARDIIQAIKEWIKKSKKAKG